MAHNGRRLFSLDTMNDSICNYDSESLVICQLRQL
jgi:hypothetical protein